MAFFEFNIAMTGLFAAQRGLQVTSNNITNANTTGYTRQEVTQKASRPLSGIGVGMTGTGVDITGVNRIRDSYIDQKLWAQNPRLGEYNIKVTQNSMIETAFGEPSEKGFTAVFNSLFNAISNLSTNPSSKENKVVVQKEMETFTKYYNNISGTLSDYQGNLNFDLKNTVNEINSLSTRVASLNEQIMNAEIYGDEASSFRDERDNCLDRLSQLINIEVEETEYEVRGNTLSKMRIKAAGQVLVDHVNCNTLELKVRGEVENKIDADVERLENAYKKVSVLESELLEKKQDISDMLTKLKEEYKYLDFTTDSNGRISTISYKKDTAYSLDDYVDNAPKDTELEKTIIDKVSNLSKAYKELDAAKAALDIAKNELDAATADFNTATTELTDAQALFNSANTKLTNAQTQLDNAKLELQANPSSAEIQQRVDEWTQKVNDFTQELNDCTTKVNDCTQKFNAAKQKVDDKKQKVADQEQVVNDKKTASEYAESELKDYEYELKFYEDPDENYTFGYLDSNAKVQYSYGFIRTQKVSAGTSDIEKQIDDKVNQLETAYKELDSAYASGNSSTIQSIQDKINNLLDALVKLDKGIEIVRDSESQNNKLLSITYTNELGNKTAVYTPVKHVDYGIQGDAEYRKDEIVYDLEELRRMCTERDNINNSLNIAREKARDIVSDFEGMSEIKKVEKDAHGNATSIVYTDKNGKDIEVFYSNGSTYHTNSTGGGKLYESDVEGLYDIKWSNGLSFDMYDVNMSGELKAIIDLRDGCGTGTSDSYCGIPYYIKRINGYVQQFAKVMNEEYSRTKDGYIEIENCSISNATYMKRDTNGNMSFYDANKNLLASNISEEDCSYSTKNALFTCTTGDRTGTPKEANKLTDYSEITAANFSISKELYDDPTKMKTVYEYAPDGKEINSSDTSFMLNLLAQKDNKQMFNEGDPKDYMVAIFSELGINAKESTMYQNTQKAVVNNLTNQRMSVSQVDITEEFTYLIKYQQAYQAAAKIMTTIDGIYETTIFKLGNF